MLLPPPLRAGAVLLAIAAVTASCVRAPPATAAAPPAPPAAPAVPAAPAISGPGIQLEVRPADAVLTIDIDSFGPVSAIPDGRVALRPGIYQLSLEREGYRTWRAEVAIRDAMEVVKVDLDPK